MRHPMLLSQAVDELLLTNVRKEDIQPNAVDLRVDKIFLLKKGVFSIDEEQKVHRGSDELHPDTQGYWSLKPGTYEIIMENQVKIPSGYAGWVITRSTLNRNGLWLSSGLYDSGYEGVMAGALHVEHGLARIQKGTRVGQFIMFEAENISMYEGDYGTGSDHDKKYGEVNGD
jgi:deoxycytidine triphosphate deaminase